MRLPFSREGGQRASNRRDLEGVELAIVPEQREHRVGRRPFGWVANLTAQTLQRRDVRRRELAPLRERLLKQLYEFFRLNRGHEEVLRGEPEFRTGDSWPSSQACRRESPPGVPNRS